MNDNNEYHDSWFDTTIEWITRPIVLVPTLILFIIIAVYFTANVAQH